MNKLNWKTFEDWATQKTIEFGMDEKWVNFTLDIVAKRVQEENLHRYNPLLTQKDK